MSEIIVLLAIIQVKHLIVDFPLQTPFQYKNKGTLGHPGGLLHAGLHGVTTALILLFYTSAPWAVALASVEAFSHYWIDWGKMNLNRIMGWGPKTHEEFWWLLGFDQFLHQIIYLGLVAILVSM